MLIEDILSTFAIHERDGFLLPEFRKSKLPMPSQGLYNILKPRFLETRDAIGLYFGILPLD